MTTAQYILENVTTINVQFFTFQRRLEVAANLARLERVDAMSGNYRYYLRFDDKSMLVALVNSDGNIIMLDAYDHIATQQ